MNWSQTKLSTFKLILRDVAFVFRLRVAGRAVFHPLSPPSDVSKLRANSRIDLPLYLVLLILRCLIHPCTGCGRRWWELIFDHKSLSWEFREHLLYLHTLLILKHVLPVGRFDFDSFRFHKFLSPDLRRHLLVLRLILIIDFECLLYFDWIVLESMPLKYQEPVDGINTAFVFFLNLPYFLL